MPRNWTSAIPQLGDFVYPDFLDKHRGQILDEYLRCYCKYWGKTPANSEVTNIPPPGGLRLFDYRKNLNDEVAACVKNRLPLHSWDTITSHFVSAGHDLEDLAKHKYYIFDCFLAQWADSLVKVKTRMQLFLPNSISSIYDTLDSVYVVADIHKLRPVISRRLVEEMGLELEVRDNKLILDCRMLDTLYMSKTTRMEFGVMETRYARLFTDGVAISSNMSWWTFPRRTSESVQLEIEDIE
ncbi:xylosidase [Colletotrichum truncatum]|uniref:Xylosidase n=1 Tax=Colletotrichum truncatum TaxID=5467 RepID=A0ACC3ZGM2_COLTU|nr:xylosidase [Colletotrichum truncatum]KAF6790444.1 xylosidase [Colletotrichum truncatum]